MPPFHLGQYVWDNHIIASAGRKGFVRISGWNEQASSDPLFFGLHFDHDRSHQKKGKRKSLRSVNERISKKHGGWGGGLLADLDYFIGRCDEHPEIVCLKRKKSYKRWTQGGKKIIIKRYTNNSFSTTPLQLPIT
jgi:hypothetical protein